MDNISDLTSTYESPDVSGFVLGQDQPDTINSVELRENELETDNIPVIIGFNNSIHGVRTISTPNSDMPSIIENNFHTETKVIEKEREVIIKQVTPSMNDISNQNFNKDKNNLHFNNEIDFSTEINKITLVQTSNASNEKLKNEIDNSVPQKERHIDVLTNSKGGATNKDTQPGGMSPEGLALMAAFNNMSQILNQNIAEQLQQQENKILLHNAAQKEEILTNFCEVTGKLDARLVNMENFSTKLHDDQNKLNDTVSVIVNKQDMITTTLDLVTEEVAELKCKYDQIQQATETNDEKLKDIITSTIVLQKDTDIFNNSLKQVQISQKYVTHKVAETVTNTNLLIAKYNKVEKELQTCEDKVNSVEAEWVVQKKELADTVTGLNSEINNNSSKINHLKEIISANKDTINEVVGHIIDPVTQLVAPLQLYVSQLEKVQTANVKTLTTDITSILGIQKDIQETYTKLQNRTTQMIDENKERDHSLQQCLLQLADLQVKIKNPVNIPINKQSVIMEKPLSFQELPPIDNDSSSYKMDTNNAYFSVPNKTLLNKDTCNLGTPIAETISLNRGSKVLIKKENRTVVEGAHQDRRPHYNGDNMPAPQFLNKVEEYLRASGVEDEMDKIDIFPTLLFGKPLKWWDLANEQYCSWEELKENFLKIHFSDYDKMRYESEWLNLHPDNFQDIENMVVTGLRLQLILNDKEHIQKLCERVTQKLPPQLSDFMLLKQFHSVNDYVIGLRETMRLKGYIHGGRQVNSKSQPTGNFYNNNSSYLNGNSNQGGNNITKNVKQTSNQQIQGGSPGQFLSPGVTPPGSFNPSTGWNIPGVSANYRGNRPIPGYRKNYGGGPNNQRWSNGQRPNPYTNPGVNAITQVAQNPNQWPFYTNPGYILPLSAEDISIIRDMVTVHKSQQIAMPSSTNAPDSQLNDGEVAIDLNNQRQG